MPTINQLSAVDQINDGDQFPLYSPNAGDARKASFTTVKESLAGDFASLADLAAQTGAGLVGTSDGTTVQQALDSKPTATLDMDGTLAANSDGRVASQKATKTYVDAYKSAVAASSGSSLVGHIATGTGAVARTVQGKLRDVVSVKDFGAVGDGVTDDTAAIQAAINAAAGRVVHFPSGTYVVTSTLSYKTATTQGIFSPGIRLVGDGMLKTIFDNRVANAPMIDIDSLNHGGSYEASMASVLREFTIKTTTSPANSTGIRVLNGYQIQIDHLFIKGMTAHGIELKNGLFVDDGWNMIAITNCWIEDCAGWGIKADGSSGRNEGSYTYLREVFFNRNGTASASTPPPSGGMIWKGQVLVIESSGWANGTENVGLFIKGDSGLGQTVDLRNTTWENCKKRGLYVTGVSVLKGRNLQFYNNNDFIATNQCEFDGSTYLIRAVDIDGVTIRATSANNALTAFKISGANADLNTCRVRNVVWENFDFAGQTRFAGWQFDTIQQECHLVVPSTVEILYRPKTVDGSGRATPVRLAGPNNQGGVGVASTSGEWVERQIPSTGVFLNPATLPLVAGTRYYIYLYDDAAVLKLEPSTTVPVADTASGYMVKTGDATRYYVGSIVGGGVNGTVATSGTGWVNPTLISGTQTGAPAYIWTDATGTLRIKTAPPASDTDGTIVGTQV